MNPYITATMVIAGFAALVALGTLGGRAISTPDDDELAAELGVTVEMTVDQLDSSHVGRLVAINGRLGRFESAQQLTAAGGWLLVISNADGDLEALACTTDTAVTVRQ